VLNVIAEMEDERTVDEVREMLKTNQSGQISNIPGNYKKIFLYDPLLRGAFSTNLLTEQIDVVKPLPWYRSSIALTDVDVQYLIMYLDEHYNLSSDKRIEGTLKVAANEYRCHPIRNYLNGLRWDGKERIRFALHHFLGAKISDYNYEVLLLFMLGAVSRVFKPGIKFDVMLCLVGGQGAGKSTFFRFLAVNDDWFTDDMQRLEDENVFRKLQGHWIIEMSEMIATASAKSIESIKSFLSRQKETYKTPYDRHPKDRKRQCVFGGSSNTLDFLPFDRTGNRRFLPVQVHSEEAEVHILENEAESRVYIDQMWAEVMEIYRKGNHDLKLSPAIEEHLKEYQKNFMPEDTKAIRIQNYLDTYKGKIICSLQLYYEALGHASYEEPKQFEIRDINSIMNNAIVGWKAFNNPRHFPEPYNRQKGWERSSDVGNREMENDGFQKISAEEAVQMELPEEWLQP
jgi:predicted P-loop ATPase